MALSDAKLILVRAATDVSFRKRFFEEPETVLSQYQLTAEERESLVKISQDPEREKCVARALDHVDFKLADIRL